MPLTGLDHVQLAMPPGGEAPARAFYDGLLGLPEVPKPPNLAARGGCWFGRGPIQVHLGVEAEFLPARKAHPAFEVDDLDGLIARLSDAGTSRAKPTSLSRAGAGSTWTIRSANRIELMERSTA